MAPFMNETYLKGELTRMTLPPKITLEAARVNAGLQQKDAADALNVTPSTLRNWENGVTSPTMEKANELAKLYNYPLDYIFFGKH